MISLCKGGSLWTKGSLWTERLGGDGLGPEEVAMGMGADGGGTGGSGAETGAESSGCDPEESIGDKGTGRN